MPARNFHSLSVASGQEGSIHRRVNQIPHEIAPYVPEAVRRVEERERPIIDLCHSGHFSVEQLRGLFGGAPLSMQKGETDYH